MYKKFTTYPNQQAMQAQTRTTKMQSPSPSTNSSGKVSSSCTVISSYQYIDCQYQPMTSKQATTKAVNHAMALASTTSNFRPPLEMETNGKPLWCLAIHFDNLDRIWTEAYMWIHTLSWFRKSKRLPAPEYKSRWIREMKRQYLC